MIIFHHNFKSIGAAISYVVSFIFYFCLIQLAPQLLNFYSEGLAWQHLFIVFVSTIITILIGYILSLLLYRIPLIEYFNGET